MFAFIASSLLAIEGSLKDEKRQCVREYFLTSIYSILDSNGRHGFRAQLDCQLSEFQYFVSSALGSGRTFTEKDLRGRPSAIFACCGTYFARCCAIRNGLPFSTNYIGVNDTSLTDADFELLTDIGGSLFCVFTDRGAKFVESFRVIP